MGKGWNLGAMVGLWARLRSGGEEQYRPLRCDADGNLFTNSQFVDQDGEGFGLKQIDGKLRVSSMPYTYDISEGNVSGHDPLLVFGRNPDVDTTQAIVGGQGGALTYLAAAEQLKVSSSSADDDGSPAGDGARTVTVYGLDENWDFLEETVTMNGLAAVTTTASFLRVYKARVATAGVDGENAGDIDVTNNAATAILCRIISGYNSSALAAWSVPRGKTLYMIQGETSVSTQQGVGVLFYVRPFGGLFYEEYRINLFGSAAPISFPLPFVIPERSDVEVRAIGESVNNDVAAAFHGWYE